MRAPATAVAIVLALTGCMPASVKTVDQWLAAFTLGDADAMAEHTWSGDRVRLKEAMAALEAAPTSTLALALPPRPTKWEILEIGDKESDARHVVLAKITMKNPLPFSSKRVGQPLEGIPETRVQRRRYLSVREADRWGVKLDLDAVLARARFVAEFTRMVERGKLDEAEAMLNDVPPPPDEANVQPHEDRLVETLRGGIQNLRARAKTSTSAASR